MDDDDFDFSDSDLDDLPANTLQQLETTAILATQRQPDHRGALHDEEIAFDGLFDVVDDDEVWDPRDTPYPADSLDSAGNPRNVLHPTQRIPAVTPDSAPVQSQADVGKLLERIRKVNLATNAYIDRG